MVIKSMLLRLSKRLTELCEEHGVAANLGVVNFADSLCEVHIPKALANERAEALDVICDELRKVEGVVNIFDHGHGRVIKGADCRRFEITVDEGLYTRTDADDKASEVYMKELFDEKYRAEMSAKKLEERRKYWKEYLLPLPAPSANPNTQLYLTMAYEPYDWIKDGYMEDGKRVYKRTEYRAYTENYARRLLSHPLKTVKLQRGYGGPGRGKPDQMVFEIKSITMWDSHADIECDPRKPVKGIVPDFFALHLGKRIS